MIQDPTDHYIATILAHADIAGKAVLEVGCGTGRITRDLARYAARVVAVDPDADALAHARQRVPAANVTFRTIAADFSDFCAAAGESRFAAVLYTLSLHHVPVAEMGDHLRTVAGLVADGGMIVVVEPGEGGSFTELKERFGAGSGDERPAQEAAIRAMHALAGWAVGETVRFRILFQFADADDVIAAKFPDFAKRSAAVQQEILAFLATHRTATGIVLDAGRQLNVLRRASAGKP